MELSEQGLILLFTIFIVLVKLLDFVVKWALERVGKKKNGALDPAVEKALRELLTELLAKEITNRLELLEKNQFTEADRQKLHELYVLHNRMDSDGIPLFYFPRSMLIAMKEVVDQLDKVVDFQRDTLRVLNSQGKAYNTMVERLHGFLTQLGTRIVLPPPPVSEELDTPRGDINGTSG